MAVKPNSLLEPEQVLSIFLDGIPEGERVKLSIHQDCDGNGKPETTSPDPCRNPLFSRDSTEAGSRTEIRDHLDFRKIDPKGELFVHGTTYFLRAARHGSVQFVEQRFGYFQDECSLLQDIFELFLGRECGAAPRLDSLGHRGPSGLAGKTFQVQTLSWTAGGTQPEAIWTLPTSGATGVSWLDQNSLLVTSGGAPGQIDLMAGLSRVDLPSGPGLAPSIELLWPAEPTQAQVAPFALGTERIAFVQQPPGPQPVGAKRDIATLMVLAKGQLHQKLPLPFKVDQILASDAAGQRLLALSLGIGEAQPTLLAIDLEEESVESLGFSSALYLASSRSPKGDRSVLSWAGLGGTPGWDLNLFDAQGRLQGRFLKEVNLDRVFPSWQPTGGGLAFLVEVKEEDEKDVPR